MRGLVALLAVLAVCHVEAYDLWNGNHELRFTIQEGATRAIAQNQWQTTLGQGTFVTFPFDCGTTSTQFIAYDNLIEDGPLKDIIDTEQLYVTYLVADFTDGTSSVINTTVNPPTGTAIDWMRQIITQINVFYNVNIQMNFVINHPDSQSTLADLNRGSAHFAIGPWGYSGYFQDTTGLTVPRFFAFERGCADRALPTGAIWSRTYATLAEFNTAYSTAPATVTIGVLGTGTCFDYTGLYGNADLQCADTVGEIDAIETSLTAASFQVTPAYIQLTAGESFSLSGSLFRKDRSVGSSSASLFAPVLAFLALPLLNVFF